MRTVTLLAQDSPRLAGAAPAADLPAFGFVLDRGAVVPQSQADPVSWLSARFGLRREPDWPVAPLLARAAGLRFTYAGWLCADPVHVELSSNPATVIPAAALALDEAESAALVEALDSHFSARGLRMFVFDSDRWLINTPLPIAIGPGSLRGKSGGIESVLACGPDATQWNAFLTEVQMLLHAHPVNAARQDAGKPPVSSLHLWGAGTDPRPVSRDALVAADDPLTLALGASAGATIAATASESVERMQGRSEVSALIVRRAARSPSAARHTLPAIDREWLAPLLNALRARRIDSLELVIPSAQGLVGSKVTRLAFWKVWKGLRPMSAGPAVDR